MALSVLADDDVSFWVGALFTQAPGSLILYEDRSHRSVCKLRKSISTSVVDVASQCGYYQTLGRVALSCIREQDRHGSLREISSDISPWLVSAILPGSKFPSQG